MKKMIFWLEFSVKMSGEVNIDQNINSSTFRLQSNERVWIFSFAFTPENRARYPFLYFLGWVFVDGEEKRINTYF